MLRPTAPKNPVPLKENIFDLNCPSSSPPPLEAYIIPALKVISAIIEVKMLNEDKLLLITNLQVDYPNIALKFELWFVIYHQSNVEDVKSFPKY